MASGTLLAILAFPAIISAQIVSTITIPTGSCVPSFNHSGPALAGFTPGIARPQSSQPASVEYVFQIEPQRSLGPRAKANDISWVGAGGQVISICGQSMVFTIQNHTLNSGGLLISTSPNTTWAPFAVSSPTGPILTDFTLIDRDLAWVNQAFNSGAARFCIANGTIFTVFQGVGPASCQDVKLLAISAVPNPCNSTESPNSTFTTANSSTSSFPTKPSAQVPSSSTLPIVHSNTTSSPSSTITASATTSKSSSVTTSSSTTALGTFSGSLLPGFRSDTSANQASSTSSAAIPTFALSSASSSGPLASSSASTSSAATSSNLTPSSGGLSTSLASMTSSSAASSSTSITSSASISSAAASSSSSSTPSPSPTTQAVTTTAPASVVTSLSTETSSYTYTTGVRLSHPTAIAANPTSADEFDDYAQTITTDFTVQIYKERDQSFTVTTNGLFVVGAADYVADQYENTELYASALPPGTICLFWDDLAVGTNSDQGIYYQTDVFGAHTMLSVEYILTPSGATTSDEICHIILRYDSDAPGHAELYYFSTGTSGVNATIGAQGFDSTDNMRALQYEFDTADTVAAGDRIALVTDLNTALNGNGTLALRTFAVDCYPPGTWPSGICNAVAP